MKSFKNIIFLYFVGLFILSLIYYQERVIYIDNALHIFTVINNNDLGIMAGRWPTSIVRLGLWLGSYLSINLDMLILIYSLSHTILIVGIAFTIYKIAGKKSLLILLLTYALNVQHTFFWCVSELIPATLLAISLYGLLKQEIVKSFYLNYAIGCFVILLCLFSHPQSILAIIFIIVYLTVEKIRKPYLIYGLLASIIFISKSIFYKNWYDDMKFEGLVHNYNMYGLKFWNLESFSIFINFLTNDYLLLLVITLSFFTMLLIKKKYIKFFVLISFQFVTLIFFLLSNPDSFQIAYFESSLYLITMMVSLVFINDLFTLKNERLTSLLMVLIFSISIVKIFFTSEKYTKRLDYVESLVIKSPYKKLILNQDQVEMDILGLDWGLPFETLIISQINSNVPTKTIVTIDYRRKYDDYLKEDQMILNGLGGTFPIIHAEKYFNFGKSVYVKDTIILFKNI